MNDFSKWTDAMWIEYEPKAEEFRVWEWLCSDTYQVTVFDATDICDLDDCKKFVLDKMNEMMESRNDG